VPLFEPRNRIQILRSMVARAVSRSRLVGLNRNSAVFHILAAAANEDAEQYFQMARLRRVFSIDNATGTDLDARATEIQPATIFRRTSLFASGSVLFTRNTTVGALPIPLGTIVAGTDSNGRVQYRTTAAATITAGNTQSAAVPVVAATAGARGNLAGNIVSQLVTKVPTLIGVTNPGAFTTGRDRETDDSFRRRLKDYVQSLARGTLRALEGFARGVVLVNGERVLFAKVVEPIIPTGVIELYIDDGSGSVETFDDQFVGGIPEEDLLLPVAGGGERRVNTSQIPIRDDIDLLVRLNDVLIVRGVDYEINLATGQIEFKVVPFPTGLTVGDKVAANYRFYTGLVQAVQKTITGDLLNPLVYPGVEAGGILTLVRNALPVFQVLVANVVPAVGFDLVTLRDNISVAMQEYINNLDIGDDVIVAEMIQQAMNVNGAFDFQVVSLNGGAPLNQVILDTQVARIQGTDITIT